MGLVKRLHPLYHIHIYIYIYTYVFSFFVYFIRRPRPTQGGARKGKRDFDTSINNDNATTMGRRRRREEEEEEQQQQQQQQQSHAACAWQDRWLQNVANFHKTEKSQFY